MTNLARSSLALALPALFGAAKSCALVNLFMICPRGRLVVSRQRPGIGCQTLLRSPRPRNHIVPQQINVRVAIRYRIAQAIEKFGTVKRNRADQMHSWRRHCAKVETSHDCEAISRCHPSARAVAGRSCAVFSRSMIRPRGAGRSANPKFPRRLPFCCASLASRTIGMWQGASRAIGAAVLRQRFR